MKYDKAELVEVEDAVKKPTRKCDVCSTNTTTACARCKTRLLLRRVPEIGVEEAQEDVQGADHHPPHKARACSSSTGASRSLELETDPQVLY